MWIQFLIWEDPWKSHDNPLNVLWKSVGRNLAGIVHRVTKSGTQLTTCTHNTAHLYMRFPGGTYDTGKYCQCRRHKETHVRSLVWEAALEKEVATYSKYYFLQENCVKQRPVVGVWSWKRATRLSDWMHYMLILIII